VSVKNIIQYSIRHKVLLKSAKNDNVWSRRLNVQTKICTGLAVFGPPGISYIWNNSIWDFVVKPSVSRYRKLAAQLGPIGSPGRH